MHKTYRRVAGLALGLIMLPVFIGLLACMPVPVGNPERSRIDDELTGVWIGVLDEEAHLFMFEPYDRRTWLVRQYEFDGDYDKAATELTYDEALAGLGEARDDDELPYFYKAWRTRIGGVWFLVWQRPGPVPGYEEAFNDEYFWYVWRIDKLDRDRVRMYMVNGDGYDAFDEIKHGLDGIDVLTIDDFWSFRRAAERVIRDNIDDPEMYEYYDDDESFVLFRMTPEDLDEL